MLQEIAGCESSTVVGIDVLKSHIEQNILHGFKNVDVLFDFREGVPIAVVGGAPSLKDNIKKLQGYRRIFACGSVHDYLIQNGIIPDYCIICDQDPVVNKYLKLVNNYTQYLVASQCNPETFSYLKNYNTYIWHAQGGKLDPEVFGKNQTLIGGGCTVGTRALVIALAFGFNNIHIYGMDSSLTDDYEHHAYKFETEEETIGNITEIKLGSEDSPVFKVADYMLAQIFDIKQVLQIYAHRAKFTVIGGGALGYIMKLAQDKVNKEVQNGH